MTTARQNAARQRHHWDAVLDADNIGRGQVSAARLMREVAFARTPDSEPLWRAVAERSSPLVLDLGGGLGTHAVALAQSTGARILVADVSGERLRALRAALIELGLADRVMTIQCAAEDLPLRTDAVDVVWTRSVLIHTDLEPAMAEIARSLSPEGQAVLCEPTVSNPLVNLYRRLFAPREWEELANHFTPEREATVLGALDDGRSERFYVLGFLAFVWQFAVRIHWLFRVSLGILGPVDRALMRVFPAWRRMAWFTVMMGRGR